MPFQLRKIAHKRKLNDTSTPCSSDAATRRRDHLEAQALKQHQRKEPLRIGKNPGLKLYIWQDPHQPREVVSDGEDDEWRGLPGSLLGSDVLARVYHCSDFASSRQESQQELQLVPANGPTGTEPRYPTAQEPRKELNIVPASSLDSASVAQECSQELGTVPANRPKRTEPITQFDKFAPARADKYGRKRTTAKLSKRSMYSQRSLTNLKKDIIWQHSTDQLTKFDPNRPYHVQAVKAKYPSPQSIFYYYRDYHLCMDLNITSARKIPQLPVRLDDRLVALVYEEFAHRDRYRLWPSEFDFDGMVRPGRIPLGLAAKHNYKVGDIDFDGNILQPGEEGWYYLWLGGIHCLMGKEGMDAGRFQPRTCSYPRIKGFAFRKSHRAEIQAPPGMESER